MYLLHNHAPLRFFVVIFSNYKLEIVFILADNFAYLKHLFVDN